MVHGILSVITLIGISVYTWSGIIEWYNKTSYDETFSPSGLPDMLCFAVKMIFLMCIIAEIIIHFKGKLKQISTTAMTLAIVVVLVLGFSFFSTMLIDCKVSDKYYSNIFHVVPPRCEEQSFEIIAINDSSTTDGKISGNTEITTTSRLFVQKTTIENVVDGYIEQKDIYKLYYVSNSETGEIRLMTLDASSTPLFYVEDGETPYLLKKTYTDYYLNKNIEPPQEFNHSKTYAYELHIPEGSIIQQFSFDLN